MEEYTTNNDLGTFEGFSFRYQRALFPDKPFTAEDVINWDHDKQGEAEFWPSGDDSFVSTVFDGRSSVSGGELKKLDELLDEIGEEYKIQIIYMVNVLNYDLEHIERRMIEDLCLQIYEGDCFCDLYKQAGWELLELYHPEVYKVVEGCQCSGVHFDPEQFLHDFSTFELEYDGSKYLIIDTQ